MSGYDKLIYIVGNVIKLKKRNTMKIIQSIYLNHDAKIAVWVCATFPVLQEYVMSHTGMHFHFLN